jgi:hypothetical protein
MKLRHAATLALIGLMFFSVTGCGGLSDSERAQEPLQREVAAGDYQRCVGNHPTDPGMCEYLKENFNGTPVVTGPSNR